MAGLSGKTALITGGSRGMGAATARLLAGAGARVVVTYSSSAAEADALAGSLPGSGHRAVQAAAEDTPALDRLARSIAEAEGRLDILVNNAGRTKPIVHADLDALDDAYFDTMMRTNVRGPFATVRACLPLLRASGEGLIVNMSSVSGIHGIGSNLAYCAAKAAVNTMTLSLARALAPDIRVVAVAPGFIDTPMSAMWTAEQRAKAIARNMAGRIGQPDEIAGIILGLATTMTYVNGTIITADGGGMITP
jgi:3-oxoacyl-[acyl-carrier protein] reductase